MYENEKCQYCGEQFAKNDDVVVCPECGAPYHRKCWEEHGECAFKDKHAEGFVFKKQNDTAEPEAGEEDDFIEKVKKEFLKDNKPSSGTKTCECCGSNLLTEDGYCINCKHQQGEPIDEKKRRKAVEKNPFEHVDPDDEILGEKASDISMVIRTNSAKLLPRLKRTDEKKFKIGWNWSAFFFGYLYLFFRKLYKYGIIIILAEVLLFNVFNVALGNPLKTIQNEGASSYTAFNDIASNTDLKDEAKTQQQQKIINDLSTTLTKDGTLQKAYAVIFGSLLICNIACALLFNYLYLHHCVETVKRMKNSADMLGAMTESEYKFNLFARGGTSIFGLIFGYFIRAFIEYIITMIISSF